MSKRPFDAVFKRYMQRKLWMYGMDVARVSAATGFSKSSIYRWMEAWAAQARMESRLSQNGSESSGVRELEF